MKRIDGTTQRDHPAVEVKDLNAWYGDSQALFGVNLRVMAGEVLGISGRNGAGKTTTLRSIMGMMPNQSGDVSIFGAPVNGRNPSYLARLGIGYCPEERGIFASLTVDENLLLPPTVCQGGFSIDEIKELFPNLQRRGRHYGGQLSGGEQQMLAIGRILRTGARILILDEPSEGLSPVFVGIIKAAMKRLKERGYTIVLVEQNLSFVMSLADRMLFLEDGYVVADEPTETVRKDLARFTHLLAL
ncbi:MULTISPECIES: ABC transporter ATP-binding protein [unclassified Burkholderia]|uniref:ABC transporter ATP-binding protein n=1 Tax=unclassified Burkholderia TaxID=2613784 RepID=UPI000F589408|nr:MULTISPECIES: ABC transporter ATP-binding protein [unclassified Burkholderia]RQR76572.1 ABC transporter ATP-binding protein [Burkholderia sp. Bp9011]RQR87326.1 ABC transporter ATP-binding protein [Burkholderia sp. Bp9010]RQS69735.1 ABC transporter ATP-binding protein [Burkholderia sp. Bp8977]